MNRYFVCMAIFFASPGLAASELQGVKLEETASVGGNALVLNGAGVRTRAFFKVYVGSLYVPAKTTSLAAVLAGPSRRVRLDFLRDLSADKLVEALEEGLEHNNSAAVLQGMKAERERMVGILRGLGEVKERSVVTIDFADGTTTISLDGQAKGSVAGAGFNQALLKVWLGDEPVQAELKRAMLGGR